MRTDERAGQAAKHTLKTLQEKVQREAMMDREGGYNFMSPEQRRITNIEIDLLKRVCGTENA